MASQSSTIYSERISLKEEHLNDILDKITIGKSLNSSEGIFLENFEISTDLDYQEFSHLSKNQVFEKVCNLLERKKSVICNLYDKDGKINDRIVSIENIFEDECCVLHLKHGDKVKIFDKFLYKIEFNLKKNEYYLESQGEFIEKITHGNDN
jgi:hypothetical protein